MQTRETRRQGILKKKTATSQAEKQYSQTVFLMRATYGTVKGAQISPRYLLFSKKPLIFIATEVCV